MCEPNPPDAWTIEGNDYSKQPRNRAKGVQYSFAFKKESPHAKEAQAEAENAYAKIISSVACGDVKLADSFLIFFTYCLVIVGWFTMRNTDETAKRTDRAYVVCGGVFGVRKNPELDTSDPEYRAVATDFQKPWLMMIHNVGRTPAYITKVRWSKCPKRDFLPFMDVLVSDILKSGKFRIRTIEVHEFYAPSDRPLCYRYVRPGRQQGWVFFGRIDYKDAYGISHHSTFALLHRYLHTDTIGESFTKDWS
jgi:hypothetical protein